jgi:hypothetical protein
MVGVTRKPTQARSGLVLALLAANVTPVWIEKTSAALPFAESVPDEHSG